MKRWLLLPLIFVSNIVVAANINLSWTNPTLNTDDTDIVLVGDGALETITLYWGACLPDNTPASPLLNVTVPATTPGAEQFAQVIITTPGDWCFVSTATNNLGLESDWSNVALKTLIASVPIPPNNLVVQAQTVYYLIQQPGTFILIPVGNIPSNTPCNPLQYVNGFFAIPENEMGKITYTGSARPLIVVAQCAP